jgi:hypothetical protein
VRSEKGAGSSAIHCPAMVSYFHRIAWKVLEWYAFTHVANSSFIDSDWAGKGGGVWCVWCGDYETGFRTAPVMYCTFVSCLAAKGEFSAVF